MKRTILIVIGIIITNFAMSQTASLELVSSAGNSFKNSTYQLDWSIGECVTETKAEGTYIITQGFHQNIYIITEVENLATDINISVYPNPTSNLITIDFKTKTKKLNILTITDLNGKILQQKEITNEQEQFNFSKYANGIYFLSVKQENKLIKSFKIIKN